MKNPAARHSLIDRFWGLGRSQRWLITALSFILILTCLGLAFLLADFSTTDRARSTEAAAAAARDTLILSVYNQSISIYNVTQEVYKNPEQRDSLRSIFAGKVTALRANQASYIENVANVPLPGRALLIEKFTQLRSRTDELIDRSSSAFTSSTSPSPAGGSARPPKPSAGQLRSGDNPATLFGGIHQSFDEALKAEMDESFGRVGRLTAMSERTTYRGILISFLLVALGTTLAVVIVRRGRQDDERRRRYEALLQASLNPIEVVDTRGSILYANPAFERWVGQTMEALSGRPLLSGFRVAGHGEGLDALWERIIQKLRLGEAWTGEVELLRENGDASYTLLYVSPVTDGAGKLVEAFAIHHDVSERRELARKFAESQEKYQNIVESSLDGIIIVQDGKLMFVNPSAAKIFAYDSPEDMKSVSFVDTIAPSNRFLVLEGHEGKGIGEDVLRNFEMKGLTKQGQVIDLEVNARLVSWGGRSAVQASFRDITTRKGLEREQALWLWEQETMSTIDRQLVSSVDLQSVLDAISYHAKSLTRADWAGVMMIDLDANQARWRAVTGNRVAMPGEPLTLEDVNAEVARATEHVIMRNLGTGTEYPIGQFPPFEVEKIVSAIRFPLFVNKEIRGQLVVGYRRQHEFAAREIRLLTSLAEKSSIALANAQLYDNLLSREQELEMLSGARVRAQEDERRRIAREIHDSLGQMLTAIKFNVEILEDAADLQTDEDRRRIADIKGLLDNAMAEAREISYNLMPSVLVDFGLVPALQFLGEQFSKRVGLNIQVHTRGVENRLDSAIEVGLYRIAQEALTNIAKHAEASEVNVQLIGDSRSIRLVVDDDGKGFQVNRFEARTHQRHGMGLLSMRERAASFNGIFVLDSHPGRGTELIVEIPRLTPDPHG